MIVKECRYDPPHTHEYPDDWEFGGANGGDPRADPRWQPTTYVYLDDHLTVVHTTQAPTCLDEALDQFTLYREDRATYLQQADGDGGLRLVDFRYDPDTDVVSPL